MNIGERVEDIRDEPRERRYPSVAVAEARIKQALLRYKAMVDRVAPSREKGKVRL